MALRGFAVVATSSAVVAALGLASAPEAVTVCLCKSVGAQPLAAAVA
jgi:hypothetical protein